MLKSKHWGMSPFIDQHCTILCILDHILIIAPTHFSFH